MCVYAIIALRRTRRVFTIFYHRKLVCDLYMHNIIPTAGLEGFRAIWIVGGGEGCPPPPSVISGGFISYTRFGRRTLSAAAAIGDERSIILLAIYTYVHRVYYYIYAGRL